MKIVLRDSLTTYASGLVQFDFGQYLEIYNTKLEDTFVQFQFIQNEIEIDQIGEFYQGCDYYKVKVPDEFLKNAAPIQCFLYYSNEESGSTEKIIVLDVKERQKYEPVPDSEEEHLIAEILDIVNYLKKQIDIFELTEEQLESVLTQVIAKMATDYYTKEKTDEAINKALAEIDLSAYVTTEEMSNAIQNILSKIDFSDYVKKEELTEAINEVLSEILDDYYTKEETDQKISDLNIDVIRKSVKEDTYCTFNFVGYGDMPAHPELFPMTKASWRAWVQKYHPYATLHEEDNVFWAEYDIIGYTIEEVDEMMSKYEERIAALESALAEKENDDEN